VKQRRESSPAGKGDSGTGTGGKKVDNNSWRTPIMKKKRDKTKPTPQEEENEEEQTTMKPRSDDEESKVGNTVDLKSMSASLERKASPKLRKARRIAQRSQTRCQGQGRRRPLRRKTKKAKNSMLCKQSYNMFISIPNMPICCQ